MIRFDAFGKTYGTQVAVHDVSLEVGAGEVVALLGPNGSGKTTCLKAVAGLIHATSGRSSSTDDRPRSRPPAGASRSSPRRSPSPTP